MQTHPCRAATKPPSLTSVVAAILLASLVTLVALSAPVDHDCVGDDCPLCLQVEIARGLLRSLAPVRFTALVWALCLMRSRPVPRGTRRVHAGPTLVAVKVKLSA
jgi:hypothetical protein